MSLNREDVICPLRGAPIEKLAIQYRVPCMYGAVDGPIDKTVDIFPEI
jgi:hypothetical protein